MSGIGTELARAVVVLEADLSDFEAGLALAQEEMKKSGEALEHLGEQLSLYVTVPLTALGVMVVKVFGEHEDAITRLNAILRATGDVSGVTGEHVLEMSMAIQATTRVSHDAVIEAAALLSTFQQVRNEVGKGNDVFDRTMQAAVGLSQAMGTDLRAAVEKLGRALENPLQGMMLLRRSNIIFNESEKEQVRVLMAHGQILEAQHIILDKVESKTRGVATAMAETPMGAFTQAWNALHTAIEPVGKDLDKVLVPLAHVVRDIADASKNMGPGFIAGVTALGVMTAAIGPLILAFVKLRAMWAGAAAIFGLGAGGLASVALLVVAAVASVTAAVVEAVANWDTLKMKWKELMLELEVDVDKAVYKIATAFSNLPGVVGRAFVGAQMAAARVLRDDIAALAKVRADIDKDLLGAGDGSSGLKGTPLGRGGKPGDRGNPELDAKINKALTELTVGLGSANVMAKALGDTFDREGARAAAYKTAIDALSKLMGDADKSPAAVKRLIDKIDELTAAMKTAQFDSIFFQMQQGIRGANEEAAAMGFTFDAAAAKAGILTTEMQEFIKQGFKLDEPINGTTETIRKLGAAIQDLQNKSKIGTFFKDEFGKASDALVEFAFGAKITFADFVKSAMMDLAKLLLRMGEIRLINKLFPNPGAEFTQLAAGGFLPAGQLALVGESGPELVRAGNTGLTVAPLSQARGTAPSGMVSAGDRLTVPVSITVQAIDSRGVQQFFQENEGLVTDVMFRAAQKSSSLRRAFAAG